MNKDKIIMILIASVIVGLLLFGSRGKKERRNEYLKIATEETKSGRQWPLPEGRMFSGAAGFLGLLFIFWAIICICGGPDAKFGSPETIIWGIGCLVISCGLFYYAFK